MSENTTRIPYDEAWLIACGLGNALLPSCYRVEIAGSLRRRRPDIGDIDLVCEPIVKPALDMFDQPTGAAVNLLHNRLDDLVQQGILTKRLNKLGHPSWGPEMRRAVHRGMNVDVQIVTDPDTWGAWLAIRTGPAAFNKALVAPRSQGGVLPPGFEFKNGFKLYRGGGQIPTPTEDELFHALGFEYQRPQDRNHLTLKAIPTAQPAPAVGAV